VQVIHRQVTVPVTHHDWRDLPDGERDAELHRLLADDLAAVLDLTQAPLLRLVIIRLTSTRALVVWTCHHLILDGWSLGQVLTDVFERYAAITSGRPPQPVTRRSFRDYLQWLRAQDSRPAEDHWRQLLSGLESPTPLPYDRRPAEAHRSESSHILRTELTQAQTARLQQSRGTPGSPSTPSSRAPGHCCCPGTAATPTSCSEPPSPAAPPNCPAPRTSSECSSTRSPPSPVSTATKMSCHGSATCRTSKLSPRRFDCVALPTLQSWSDLPRTQNLFDSMVAFENYPYEEAAAAEAGLRIRDVKALDTTNYPWPCAPTWPASSTSTSPSTPAIRPGHRRAGHPPPAHAAHCHHRPPGSPLRQLPWMSPQERQHILTHSNHSNTAPGSTAPGRAPAQTLVGLFEAQASRTPDATAVTCGDASLSYRQLNTQANRLAHRLAALGAGPETPGGPRIATLDGHGDRHRRGPQGRSGLPAD